MRRLILTTGLLAAALMAMPQSALAQANQPLGGGGGMQQPNPSEPRTGRSPSTRPSDESVGAGEMQRRTEPGTRGVRPDDQPIGGGGGVQEPNPSGPRR
jgi:hypothetical protein